MSTEYNIFRWYRAGWGRYTQADPLGKQGDPHPYTYALANPVMNTDATGEKSRVCCVPVSFGSKVDFIPTARYFQHCFIEQRDDNTNALNTYSLHRMSSDWGCTFEGDSFDKGAVGSPRTSCGPWKDDCLADACVKSAHRAYPRSSEYGLVIGSNSNSYTSYVSQMCGMTPPLIVNTPGRAPGWGDPVAAARTNKKCSPKR